MHSHAYWMPLSWGYGLLPNLAIFANAFTSRWELGRFKMIHVITDEYPVTHKDVRCIPNFVDSRYLQAKWKEEWTIHRGVLFAEGVAEGI